MKQYFIYFEYLILSSLIILELISLFYFFKMKYLFLIPTYQILVFGSNQKGITIDIIIFALIAAIPVIGFFIFKKENFFSMHYFCQLFFSMQLCS